MNTRDGETGTKDRLRDAALALFARKGYDATGTREICAAAHCNIAMISHYYGSKEGLFLSIVADFMASEADELRRLAASSLPPDVQLAQFIDFMVDGIARRPPAMLMYRETWDRPIAAASSLRDQMDGNIRMIGDLMDKAGTSRVASLPPRQLAYMLIGMLVFYFSHDGNGFRTPSDVEISALGAFARSRFIPPSSAQPDGASSASTCAAQDSEL